MASTPHGQSSGGCARKPGRARAKPPPRRCGSRCCDEVGHTEFLGYDTEEAEGTILAMFKDGARRPAPRPAKPCRFSPTRRPSMPNPAVRSAIRGHGIGAGARARHRHREEAWRAACPCRQNRPKAASTLGDAVDLKVDGEHRRATRANHSATHLLHAALEACAGHSCRQKGSLVAPDRLRFDFSHPKPVTPEELQPIERQVNEVIRQNSRRLHPPDADRPGDRSGRRSAVRRKIRRRSARAHDGRRRPQALSRSNCAAARMCTVWAISGFSPSSAESAVAAGVRRIEALTSEGARRYLAEQAEMAREAAHGAQDPVRRNCRRASRQLVGERRRLERELGDAKKALALAGPAQGGGDDGSRPSPASRPCCARRWRERRRI